MENLLFLGVPILKHIRVSNRPSGIFNVKTLTFCEANTAISDNANAGGSAIALPVHSYRQLS